MELDKHCGEHPDKKAHIPWSERRQFIGYRTGPHTVNWLSPELSTVWEYHIVCLNTIQQVEEEAHDAKR